MTKYLIFWFLLWYIIGSFYLIIQALPEVTIFNIEKSMISEGSQLTLVDNSIVKVLTVSLLWPVLLGVQLTIGVFLSAEVVGYEYNSNPLLLLTLYYGKLILNSLPIGILGSLSAGVIFIHYYKYGRIKNLNSDDGKKKPLND